MTTDYAYPTRVWHVSAGPHGTAEEIRGYKLEFTDGALVFRLDSDNYHSVAAYAPGQWVEVSGGSRVDGREG